MSETLGPDEFMNAVWGAVTELYGEYGASRAGLTMINYDTERKVATIRVLNAALDMIRAALASITKIGEKHVAVHVLAVSGTLKALNGN